MRCSYRSLSLNKRAVVWSTRLSPFPHYVYKLFQQRQLKKSVNFMTAICPIFFKLSFYLFQHKILMMLYNKMNTKKKNFIKEWKTNKKSSKKFQQMKINIYWEFYYFINSFNVLWFWWRIDLKCFTANKKINILWSIDFLIEICNNPVHFAIKNP